MAEGALDPERHLSRSRHGDWPTSTAKDLPTPKDNVWGVSVVPSTILQQTKKVRFDEETSELEQYSSLSSRQAQR